MPSPLLCGSFQNHPDEDFEFLGSFTSPRSRKPTKWHSFGGSKGNKNPYADRGLDKFSVLMAELDSKRKKIYTQKGSEDISLLGFVYSNSDDYKPIVVRLKNKKQPSMTSEKDKLKPVQNISPPASSEIEPAKPADTIKVLSRMGSYLMTTPKKVTFDVVKNIKMDNLRQPWYYISLITIFILVSLAVFGRSFAVLCTTLGWYLVPTIQKLNVKKKIKANKKTYVKALSCNDKIITSKDNEMSNLKKTKTMKKAMSYNNKNVKISSSTFDHGIASPSSTVLNGYKSPSQPASPPQDHRLSFPTQAN